MPMLSNVDLGGDHAVLGMYRVYQERRNLRAATITNRAWALAAFIRHIAPLSLLDADEDDVQTWLDSRALSPKSRSCDISTLHCFYEFCQPPPTSFGTILPVRFTAAATTSDSRRNCWVTPRRRPRPSTSPSPPAKPQRWSATSGCLSVRAC